MVDVGDYTVTVYLQEENINQYLLSPYIIDPWEITVLQREWESNPAQEVVVLSYTDEQGAPVIDIKKDTGTSGRALHKVQSVNPRWRTTLSIIKKWKCASCPYGSEILLHHQPAARDDNKASIIEDHSLLLQPPSQCQLKVLNDDALTEIASQLSSESIISFSAAYTRFREVAASFHVLLHRELRCFFLRTSLHQSTLGVGIALDPRSHVLSSDFDWLSTEAFDVFNVRTSIQKRGFGFFLPLAFNRPHFDRARVDIWKRLAIIDSAIHNTDLAANSRSARQNLRKLIRTPGKPVPSPKRPVPAPERPVLDKKPHSAVTVLYRMMNNIVVSLMKSCEETLKSPKGRSPYAPARAFLHASEKAITSYCHLLHLLMCLSRSTPAILHDATWCLRRFVTHPNTRSKKETPDLGQMIVLINLVVILPTIDHLPPMSWDAISTHYLKEALTRNVRWVLQEAPELEVMEQGTSDYRLNTTFSKSKTSLRLIMFQITFLNLFIETYASGISRLDENYGFADKELPERMVKEIREIFAVDTWPEFFSRVRFTHGMNFTKEKVSAILRQTVQDSAALGYHTPPEDMIRLKDKRVTLDKTSSFCAVACPNTPS